MTQERSGDTVITSVSLSKVFHNLLKKTGFSPTEVMRRGIAVTMCDQGIGYVNDMNKQRLIKSSEILKEIQEREKIRELLSKVKDALEELDAYY